MIKRIGITGAVLVAALTLSGLGASAASASSCYKISEFIRGTKGGNYEDNLCTKEVDELDGEYVLATLIKEKSGTKGLWCAELLLSSSETHKDTGFYTSNTCETELSSADKNDSNWTEVIKEATKVLPEPSVASPIKSTASDSTETFLEQANGNKVHCAKGGGSGEATSANLGNFIYLFTECKGPLTTTCTTTGDPTGLIGISGTVHYWLALLGKSLVAALVFLLTTITFVCKSATVSFTTEVKPGCQAALATPTEKPVNTTEDIFKETSGHADITLVLPQETTKEIDCELESKIDTAAFEPAAQSGTFTNTAFTQGGSKIAVELMN
jgi:hypothetical protein